MATQYIDVAKEATSQQILSTVNNGAKESTSQQILSNVGSLAKESTSQEILSKLESGGGGSSSPAVKALKGAADYTISNMSNYKTILNVSGKGRLCYALVNGGSTDNSKVSIRVTLDDKVICFITGKNSATSPVGSIFVGCYSHKYRSADAYGYNSSTYAALIGSMFPTPVIGSYLTHQTMNSDYDLLDFSSSEQSSVSSTGAGMSRYIWIDEEIPFTKNLKVEYFVQSAAMGYTGVVTAGYKLDE